jgi:hypothetical protein
MTGAELERRLTETGLGVDGLAEALHKHPDEVRAWTTIEGRLPGFVQREVDWVLAVDERARLMAASGLPTCAWMVAHATVPPGNREALRAYVREVEAHRRDCEVCRRRAAYADTLPPLPPLPMPATARALGWISRQVGRLPRWARPAAVGAMVIGGWTAARAALELLLHPSAFSARSLLTVVEAIGVGAYAGLVGGLAYHLVREPTRPLGRAGDYLTGVACAYAYLAAFGIPLGLLTHDDLFRSTAGWITLLVVGTLLGVLVGHFWFRGDRAAVARGD